MILALRIPRDICNIVYYKSFIFQIVYQNHRTVPIYGIWGIVREGPQRYSGILEIVLVLSFPQQDPGPGDCEKKLLWMRYVNK